MTIINLKTINMTNLLKLSKKEIIENLAISSLITLSGFFIACTFVAIISIF